MQLTIYMPELLLLLKFYLLKIISSFYGFFFFCNRKYPFLYTVLFCIHYLFRGIKKKKKSLNAFQKWILTGTKLLEPRVQLLKVHYENLNLGPWRAAAKESICLSLLLHMRNHIKIVLHFLSC